MDLKILMRIAAIVSLLSILLTSCSTVPVTGRRQINLMSDTEVVKMTKAEFERMKRQMPISRDPRMNEWLTDVSEHISQQVFWDMPLAEWEFVVFDMPGQINAFAMPGGKVGVFSGLFDMVETQDELASVIAHEIAHVTARHTHERMSQAGILKAGSGIASLGTTIATGGMIYGAAPSMSGQLAAWDRAKESEADRIGIMYMANAGFDPQAAITVMEKMAAMDLGGGSSRPYNSTHPSSEERLDSLHSYLEEANAAYEKAKELRF
ncbi:MAG: M48 family metallopeptidase [Opitutaceae bacterium]|nr:M48 family metallopeptidase [Opitutaceae bacterium]